MPPKSRSTNTRTSTSSPPAVADSVLDEVDLSGAPALRPAATLRIGQRKAFLQIATEIDAKADDDGNVELASMLDKLEQMDLALEGVAVEPDAYAAWAVGADVEQRVAALFMQYAGQLGESTRSAG
ncbi:hypothetical protein [Thalassiella azotivora]